MKNDVDMKRISGPGPFAYASVTVNIFSQHQAWLDDEAHDAVWGERARFISYYDAEMGDKVCYVMSKTQFNEFVQHFYGDERIFPRTPQWLLDEAHSQNIKPPPVPTVVYKVQDKVTKEFVCANGVSDETVGSVFAKKNQVSSHLDWRSPENDDVVTYELVEVSRVSGKEWLKNMKSKPRKK
jgi:hypothetical protein